jgi:hypothetical protein
MSDRHISLLFFSLMKNRMTDFDQQTYARMRLEGVKYKLNENGSFLLKGFFLTILIRMTRAVLISMRKVHSLCLDHHHS